jgi:hypothetical protein
MGLCLPAHPIPVHFSGFSPAFQVKTQLFGRRSNQILPLWHQYFALTIKRLFVYCYPQIPQRTFTKTKDSCLIIKNHVQKQFQPHLPCRQLAAHANHRNLLPENRIRP